MNQHTWASSGIKFVGTATSHFQSEPICEKSHFPSSDWELELRRKMSGRTSGIKIPVVNDLLPRFLPHKAQYIQRSTELGLNMFRFSFDLARLSPQTDDFNVELMAEYVRTMALARVMRHEPFVTLHHFTMPLRYIGVGKDGAITSGGWEHPDIHKHFRFTVERVVKFLSNRDALRKALAQEKLDSHTMERLLTEGLGRYFMPFNEPAVTLGNSYLAGVFPPYKRGQIGTCVRIVHKMAEVQTVITDLLRRLGDKYPPYRVPLIGNGYNWQYFDGVGASLMHVVANEWHTRVLERGFTSDFLGLHYYCRTPLLFAKSHPGDMGRGDHPVFGPINPQGIGKVLEKMHAAYPSKDIFVSEIGFSDASDLRRPYWLLQTVRHVLAASRNGIPVRGILVWSLVNNFEWELALSQKFGLFDEGELGKELSSPKVQAVRSWQVLRALARHIRHPSEASLAEIEHLEHQAYLQYELASLR